MSGHWTPKKGDRVRWRDRLGTVTNDYWRHRDRFSVRLDDAEIDLDFGADALRPA